MIPEYSEYSVVRLFVCFIEIGINIYQTEQTKQMNGINITIGDQNVTKNGNLQTLPQFGYFLISRKFV